MPRHTALPEWSASSTPYQERLTPSRPSRAGVPSRGPTSIVRVPGSGSTSDSHRTAPAGESTATAMSGECDFETRTRPEGDPR